MSNFLGDLSSQSTADKSSSSHVTYNLLQLPALAGFTKLLSPILVGTDEPRQKAFDKSNQEHFLRTVGPFWGCI